MTLRSFGPVCRIESTFVSQCKRTQRLRALYHDILPPLVDVRENETFKKDQLRLNNEDYFDQMMERCHDMTINNAFEPILTEAFSSSRSLVWKFDDVSNSFLSGTLNKVISEKDSLLFAASQCNTPLNVTSVEREEELALLEMEPYSPQLFFPLRIRNGPLLFICQISRHIASTRFSEHEVKTAQFFMNKFSIYGMTILPHINSLNLSAKVSLISDVESTTKMIKNVMETAFNACQVDFWLYTEKSNEFYKFCMESHRFVQQNRSKVGIVGYGLMAGININEKCAKYHSNYYQPIDGDPDLPIIVSVCKIEKCRYAVSLRRDRNKFSFDLNEKRLLSEMTPFICRSIAYSLDLLKRSSDEKPQEECSILTLIKESAVILTADNMDTLISSAKTALRNTFMKESSISLVDGNQIVTNFGTGYSDSTRYNILSGITGTVIESRCGGLFTNLEKMNSFNPDVDCSGMNNVSEIIIVPIFSVTNTILGTLSILNTDDERRLCKEDISKLSSISVFVSSALSKIRLNIGIKDVFRHISTHLLFQNITPKGAVNTAFKLAQNMFDIKSTSMFAYREDELKMTYSSGKCDPAEVLPYINQCIKENITKVFEVGNKIHKSNDTPSVDTNGHKSKNESCFFTNEVEDPDDNIINISENTVRSVMCTVVDSMNGKDPATSFPPPVNDVSDFLDSNDESKSHALQSANTTKNTVTNYHGGTQNYKEIRSIADESIDTTVEKDLDKFIDNKEFDDDVGGDVLAETRVKDSFKESDAEKSEVNSISMDVDAHHSNKSHTSLADSTRLDSSLPTIRRYLVCTPIVNGSNVVGAFQTTFVLRHSGEESLAEIISNYGAFISKNFGFEPSQSNNEETSEFEVIIDDQKYQDNIVPNILKTQVDVDGTDFPISKLDKTEHVKLAIKIFDHSDVIRNFNIDIKVLFNFLTSVQRTATTKHHDFVHAVSVLQASYIISRDSVGAALRDVELLALFIASIIHDVKHHGCSTIKCKGADALIPFMPNEIGSLSYFYDLLRDDSTNILKGIPNNKEVIRLVTELVRATNMSLHFKLIDQLNQHISHRVNLRNDDHRLTILKVILKAADLSEAFRSDPVKEGLFDEFIADGDISRCGVVIEDVFLRSTVNYEKSSSALCNNVLLLLYGTLTKALPGVTPYNERVKSNIEERK